MKKKRIWIVSELFYPDEASTGYIMTSIAEALAENSEVHVICGPSGYNSLSIKGESKSFDFVIHRVKSLNLDKNNVFTRGVRLLFLSLSFFFKGLLNIKKTDTVLIVTNPAFVVPFFALIRIIKKCELFILVHDVFPENLIPARIVKSAKGISYLITKKIFDLSYQMADHLLVLGEDMADIIAKKTNYKTAISIIENWGDIENIKPEPFHGNPLIEKYHLNEKIVFTFAGNLGRVQGLDYLMDIIAIINNPVIHFLFIGDGVMIPELKAFINKHQLKNITLAGPLARSRQKIFLNAAHFGLVTLTSELYGLGVPSKSYNILAAGKPILFMGSENSEIALMIKQHNCGFVFGDGSKEQLIEFFDQMSISKLAELKLMGLNARRLVETRYSKNYILDKFRKVVNG